MAAHVLINLDHLQLDFGDLALGLGDGRHQLAALAFEPRRLALQRIDTGLGHELLVVKGLNADQLAFDEFDFVLLGVSLFRIALDLLFQLIDPLAQLLFLSLTGFEAELEVPLLAGYHFLHERARSCATSAPPEIRLWRRHSVQRRAGPRAP